MSDLVFKIGMTVTAVGWFLMVVGDLTGLMSPAIGCGMALSGAAMAWTFMVYDMWRN